MSHHTGGPTAARGEFSGVQSTGANWVEDIEISLSDAAVTDAEDWEWRFTFSKCDGASPNLTLSTTAGTLAIVQGDTSTTIQIRVPATDLSSLCGDYLGDLASMDDDDLVIHWLHGVLTFRQEPPVWS